MDSMESLEKGMSLKELSTLKLMDMQQGLFGGSTSMLLFKWLNFILCLAALATAGLGESLPSFV